MMMHCERSTRRLSPKVSVALSRMPSRSCQSESEAFRSRQRAGSRALASPYATGSALPGSAADGSRGVPGSPEASRSTWRFRGNVGNSAQSILDAGAGVAEERLGQSLDDTGFPGTGGPQKQEIPDRARRGVQSGQEHLVDLDYFVDGLVLSNILRRRALSTPGHRYFDDWDRAQWRDAFS